MIELTGHSRQVMPLVYSPDGQALLTGGADGVAKLWNLNGRLRHEFDWQLGDISAVAFAPDGLTAAVGG